MSATPAASSPIPNRSRKTLVIVLAMLGGIGLLSCLGVTVCTGLLGISAMKGAKIESGATILGGHEQAYLSVIIDTREQGQREFFESLQRKANAIQRQRLEKQGIPTWFTALAGMRSVNAGRARLEMCRYEVRGEADPTSALVGSVQLDRGMGVVSLLLGTLLKHVGPDDPRRQVESHARGDLVITEPVDGTPTGISISSERVLFGSAIDEMRRILDRPDDQNSSPASAELSELRTLVAGGEQQFWGLTLAPSTLLEWRRTPDPADEPNSPRAAATTAATSTSSPSASSDDRRAQEQATLRALRAAAFGGRIIDEDHASLMIAMVPRDGAPGDSQIAGAAERLLQRWFDHPPLQTKLTRTPADGATLVWQVEFSHLQEALDALLTRLIEAPHSTARHP